MFLHSTIIERAANYEQHGPAIILLMADTDSSHIDTLLADNPITLPAQDIRAVIRRVELKPFGNFAAARVRIGGQVFSYWGDYGEGNRPIVVPAPVHHAAKVRVPNELLIRWHTLVNQGNQRAADRLMYDWATRNRTALTAGVAVKSTTT